MKDQVASKLLTGDQAGSSPFVDPRYSKCSRTWQKMKASYQLCES